MSWVKKLTGGLMAGMMLALLAGAPVYAQSQVRLEGVLKVNGALINGTQTTTFTLYSPSNVQIWTSGQMPVTYRDGFFAVNLGPFTADQFRLPNSFFGIEIQGQAERPVTINAVPQAFFAFEAGSVEWADVQSKPSIDQLGGVAALTQLPAIPDSKLTGTLSATRIPIGNSLTNAGGVIDVVPGNTDGEVLQWNAGTSRWEPVGLPGVTPHGVLPDHGLQLAGNDFGLIDGTAANQVLKWDGLKWVLSTDADTDTTYSAGSGLTLTGTTFALASTAATAGTYGSATHVARLTVDGQGRITNAATVTINGVSPGGTAAGDLAGTYPNPTVAQIQGRAVAATAPADGQVLKWNAGTSQWELGPDTDTDTNTTYGVIANKGLQLDGTNNFGLINGTADGQILKWNNATGQWELGADGGGTTYGVIANQGLQLAGNNFGLIGGTADGQVLKWNNGTGQWELGTDNAGSTAYTAGAGLSLTGTTFSTNLAANDGVINEAGDLVNWFELKDVPAGFVDGVDNDTDTTYGVIANQGLQLDGSNNFGLIGGTVTGQVLKWNNGTGQWELGADNDTDTNTTYTAGTGISLTGTTFSTNLAANDGVINEAGDLLNWFELKDVPAGFADGVDNDTDTTYGVIANQGLQLDGSNNFGLIGGTVTGQVLKWNNGTGQWELGTDTDTDTNTTYTAGTGISLTGTTFSTNLAANDGVINEAGDLLNWFELKDVPAGFADGVDNDTDTTYGVIANQGLQLDGSNNFGLIGGTVTGQVLKWNNGTGQWELGTDNDTDTNTTYTAGTGLELTGTTFALSDTAVTAGTYGNATNVPQFTVDAQGRITGVSNVAITIVSNFTGLTDTPGSYTGNGGQLVRVNGTEDGLEFVDAATLSVANAGTLDGLDSTDFAAAVHTHDGADITAGTVDESVIDGAIARDTEVLGIVLASDGSGSGLDADAVDGLSSGSFLRSDAASALTAGNTLTLNGDLVANGAATVASLTRGTDTITDFTGNGLQLSTGALGLGPLSANWNQTGAFDIVLNNTAAEISMLDSDGTHFGTLDMGNLTAARTYTFPDSTGTVVLSGTLLSTLQGVDGSGSGLDADLLDGISSGSFLRTDASSAVAAGNTLTINGNLSVANITRGVDTITDFTGTGLQVAGGALGLTNTGVTAATYGSATTVPQITVDAQGRITEVTNVGVIASDADTLDTLDSTAFLRSNANATYSGGTLSFSNTASLAFNNVVDFRVNGNASGNNAGGKIVFGSQIFSTDQAVIHHHADNNLRIEALGEIELRANTSGTRRISLTPGTGGVVVNGNLSVTGTVSKGGGTFDIVHPDPEKAKDGWRLRHSFVESPTRGDNLYRYQVTVKSGKAEIQLPDYFKHLNENAQIWVSPVKHFGSAYGEVNEASTLLTIHANADGLYNVLVVATRKDKLVKEFWDPKGAEYRN